MKTVFKQKWSTNFRNSVFGSPYKIYPLSSPRQCSLHYQMVVQPREEGRMVTLDPITKKTRRVPLSTGEMSKSRKFCLCR